MRARTLFPALVLAAAAVVALAGCTFEAGPTVSPGAVAKKTADELEKQVGQRPEVDCGTKSIIVVDGKTITCELTAPDTGDVYDVKVTFDVKDSHYSIAAKVADTPKSTGDGGDGGGTSSDEQTSPSPDAVTEPGTKIASLAANALAAKLGFTPDIVCAEDEVPISEGYVESCSYSHDGAEHDVSVTITDFDGSNYHIDAKVMN